MRNGYFTNGPLGVREIERLHDVHVLLAAHAHLHVVVARALRRVVDFALRAESLSAERRERDQPARLKNRQPMPGGEGLRSGNGRQYGGIAVEA